ncbi:hypothetical protein BgiMline_015889, partial [Biomphalaria glabrata]
MEAKCPTFPNSLSRQMSNFPKLLVQPNVQLSQTPCPGKCPTFPNSLSRQTHNFRLFFL